MRMAKAGKQAFRRCAAVLATAACLAIAVGNIPRDALFSFGQSLALLSAGLQQPEGGAVALNGRLEQLPSGNSPGKNGESWIPGASSEEADAQKPEDADSSGSDTPLVPATREPPPRSENSGDIVTQQISAGSSFVQGIAIKNASSRTVDIASELAQKPDLGLTDTTEPQVLIMHTHTSECYMTYDAGYYNSDDPVRSSDPTCSVLAVGETIAATLREAGIGVIHDSTFHDSPKYSGAYERSAVTVQGILDQYPSIKVVLDIHRDAMTQGDGTKIKPTVEIDGKKAAQCMIIASTCDTEAVPHPNWKQNLRFALRLQSALHTKYEGLVRPLYLVDSRYNQHLTNGSLLIEVGSDSNTVEEAVYSGQLVGKTLAQVLDELKS